MQEQVVDANLESFLNKSPEVDKKAASVPSVEDEINEEEEQVEEEDLPSSTNDQQNVILDLVSDLKQDEIPVKHIGLLTSVKQLNTLEADKVIRILRRVKARSFTRSMTVMLVENALTRGLGVRSHTDVETIKNDEVLINELGEWVSGWVDHVGKWKGPLLFLYYSIGALIKQQNQDASLGQAAPSRGGLGGWLFRRAQQAVPAPAKRAVETEHHDEASVSSDGGSKVTNG